MGAGGSQLGVSNLSNNITQRKKIAGYGYSAACFIQTFVNLWLNTEFDLVAPTWRTWPKSLVILFDCFKNCYRDPVFCVDFVLICNSLMVFHPECLLSFLGHDRNKNIKKIWMGVISGINEHLWEIAPPISLDILQQSLTLYLFMNHTRILCEFRFLAAIWSSPINYQWWLSIREADLSCLNLLSYLLLSLLYALCTKNDSLLQNCLIFPLHSLKLMMWKW